MGKGAGTIMLDTIIGTTKLRRVLVITKRENIKWCVITIMVSLVEEI